MERAGVYGRQSRGKAKSITDQIAAGEEVCEAEGWQLVETYQDGSSASRYARKGRDDWQRCLGDIEAGHLTILILWESSRGDRTLTTWSAMLDLCRDRGVRIYVVSHERLYDPRKHRDWKTLAEDGIASASETDLLSLRVRRGHASSAKAGRPAHGKTPIGYKRTYDPDSGELSGQVPDERHRETVVEIITRVAARVPISRLEREFNERGVPTIDGARRWYRQRFADIARNPAYIGVRVYNGQQYPGAWPGLVDPEVFQAAQRVLADPKRLSVKPGRQRHLLSYLATAAPCGGPLMAVRGRYRCYDDGCVTIVQDDTDALVTEQLLLRLSHEDVYGRLRQQGDEADAKATAAREELAELNSRMDDWRRSAALGNTSPESFAVIEAEIKGMIRKLEKEIGPGESPPELMALIAPGGDVRARWSVLTVQARRAVLRQACVLTVDRADNPGSRTFEPWRLAGSQWVGDDLTWGQRWAS